MLGTFSVHGYVLSLFCSDTSLHRPGVRRDGCYDPREVKSPAPHDTKTDVEVILSSP